MAFWVEMSPKGRFRVLMPLFRPTRAEGAAAGFGGISSLNADNSHAKVNTSSMTGIDARVPEEPQAASPKGVGLGVMNESTAWNVTGGRCSLIRCYPPARLGGRGL